MFDQKMTGLARALVALLAAAFVLTGCELSQIPQATPTSNTEPLTPTLLPTDTLPPTLTMPPQLESPSPTNTAGTPTETPTETPTPDPYATYVIQPGDTMYYILQQPPFYYQSQSWNAVIAEVLEINPFLRSADRLPGPGSSILVPLPTPTVTPEGYSLTATAQPRAPQMSLPSNAEIIQVEVKEGQTIIGIAQSSSTTLSIVATLNPQLDFLSCDFSNPSGGPGCSVPLSIGDVVNVPALTPTPTLSPTISGSETPTPTPTYSAPMLVYPPQDASAPPRTFQLQWVSVGELKEDESYLVEIVDDTAGTNKIDVTRSNSYELPDDLVPTDGQTHTIRWRVWVGVPNQQGMYRPVGAQGDYRTFRWQSR